MSDLLHTPMPRFAPEEVLAWVEQRYGIGAESVTALSSERDQLLRLDEVVVKISNRAERADTLDMENAALAHLAAVAPELPVPRVVPTRDGDPVGTITDSAGQSHLVRVLTVVPGRAAEGQPIDPELAERIGAVSARVSTGLQGFFHRDAGRRIAWDIRIQRMSDEDPPTLAAARSRIGRALAASAALPSGVQHGDLTLTNVLLDEERVASGVVDLGDMHHTAAICDAAVSLTAVLRNSGSLRVPWSELAAAFLDGYQRVRPLWPEEASVLGHLVLARLVTTLDISRSRASEHPDNHDTIVQYDATSGVLLEELVGLDDPALAHAFSRLAGLPTRSGPWGDLRARRDIVLGGRLSPTFYQEPLTIVGGDGARLVGDDGEPYLDAYNNVAVAGHTHPAITQAVVRQLRTLNTNSRYLHPSTVELAERLLATMPPELDTCVFVTSGSEAVDLAWRMARAYTGHGGTLIAEWAYHGISTRTYDFSPNDWPTPLDPPDVATFRAPHAGEGVLDEAEARRRVAAAVSTLDDRGHRPGLLVVDPQFTSEGILDAPPEFMAGLVAGIHEHGGLFLADEVQSGFGRSGPGLWRFATFGITPDVVTLGKPMAAGLPVGAVITRRAIAQALGYEYFSTFAGSPVAGAAGLAVLDVLADRRIPERAVRVGEHLRARLRELAAAYPVVGAVRGTGLIAGIDLLTSREVARDVVEGLKARRVLAGATGRTGTVLKVRPPLTWTEMHADRFVSTLRHVLDTL
jgi:4-aminobutyrate aminotransferase-like enzyme/Ser/Thr protein kinase RdoA (MazF antagonist)